MTRVRMKGVTGSGGFEIGNARYLPDANGILVVAPQHVSHARASGYVEIEEVTPPPAPAVKRPTPQAVTGTEEAKPDASEREGAGE